MNQIKNHQLGMIYGLLVGDALGCPVEFRSPGAFAPVTGYRTGTHNVPPGCHTDDGAMALALCHSLKERGGFDLASQMDHYCAWRNGDKKYNPMGCFDIGGQTSGALSRWAARGYSGGGYQASQSGFQKSIAGWDSESSGNGSIMRLAPVPAFYLPSVWDKRGRSAWNALRDLCGISSVTTHPNRLCVTACQLLGTLCAALAVSSQMQDRRSKRGLSASERVQCAFSTAERLVFQNNPDACPKVRQMFIGHDFLTKSEREIGNSGYALSTLEAACWAFGTTTSFRECVLKGVNLGGDSDTIGATAGSLAGSFYGFSGIPSEFVKGLYGKQQIEDALDGLF